MAFNKFGYNNFKKRVEAMYNYRWLKIIPKKNAS